jgi:hypothetical protein
MPGMTLAVVVDRWRAPGRAALAVVALLLAGACGRRAEEPREPGRADDAPVTVPVPSADDGGPGEAAALTDEDFRDLAEALARRTARRVAAWGTAPLADDDTPRRFAVLDADEPLGGRGAYLVEAAPGALWLVAFSVDGRTMAWAVPAGGAGDGEAPWTARADLGIEHGQGHRRGGETLTFAVRGGQLVVLEHEYVEDAAEDEPVTRRFAEFGVCATPCPPLAGYPTTDLDLAVRGPAAALDALLPAR